nr:mycofactocin system glycosyltransferase [Actinomycetota bacterium]
MTTPLPAGFRVELDRDTKRIDHRTLFGGAPARVLRLSATGQDALGEILGGPVHSASGRTLGRRLTDTGLAHPVPPPAPPLTVTVLIPVRD